MTSKNWIQPRNSSTPFDFISLIIDRTPIKEEKKNNKTTPPTSIVPTKTNSSLKISKIPMNPVEDGGVHTSHKYPFHNL